MIFAKIVYNLLYKFTRRKPYYKKYPQDWYTDVSYDIVLSIFGCTYQARDITRGHLGG